MLLNANNTNQSFLSNIDETEMEIINQLRSIILSYDPAVNEKVGKIMQSDKSLIYEQENVFKYGIAKTNKYFTFHSMVMYAYEDISDYIRKNSSGLKIQKGCINIPDIEELALDIFERLIEKSADKDFSSVIKTYKRRSI